MDSEVLETKILSVRVKGHAWYAFTLNTIFIRDSYDTVSRNIALGFRIIKLTNYVKNT